MDETFTPLFSAIPGGFNSISGPASSPSSRPTRNAVGEKSSAAPSPPQHACVKAATPLVTFRKEGDRVTQIHIECPCGQIVVLDCEY
jgi:hypothetical protein